MIFDDGWTTVEGVGGAVREVCGRGGLVTETYRVTDCKTDEGTKGK